MGKRLRRKCTAMDEPTVMEARTGAARRLGLVTAGSSWSSKRRKTALASRRYRNANPSLQIRSVVLEPRIARSMAKSAGQSKSSAGLGRISRCSSNASCEVAPTRSASSEVTVATECGSALFLRCNGERRETSASSNRCDEASDLESTVETEPRARSGEAATPSNAELEEFFAAAEKDLRQKFAERYNFDVVNDLPMAGRYEWIPLHSLKKC